jgi:thiamine-phosphate pyrophosphorylase
VPLAEPIPFRLPRFYPILDTFTVSERGYSMLVAAEALLEAGVRILQYRHKENWTQAHFEEAKRIATLCQEAGVLFVLNDRADFARMMGAALHLGQDDLPPAAARRVVSDEVIGFSTHNRLQLTRANDEAVEYLSLGPIFTTNSKERPDPVVGVDGLAELRGLTAKPLVAIGGITLENTAAILQAGADSVAVISGILWPQGKRIDVRRRAEAWIRLVSQIAIAGRPGGMLA